MQQLAPSKPIRSYAALRDLFKPVYLDLCQSLVKTLGSGDVRGFLTLLARHLATIPYPLSVRPNEAYFHKHVHDLLSPLNFRVTSEKVLASGRADLVVETPKFVWIFEFKVTPPSSAEKALEQIDRLQYDLPYRLKRKKILRVGVAFSPRLRNILSWTCD